MSVITEWVPIFQADEVSPTPRPFNDWVLKSGESFYLIDGFASDDAGHPVAGWPLQDDEIVTFCGSAYLEEQAITVDEHGEVGAIDWPEGATGAWVPYDDDTGTQDADGLRDVLADLGPGEWLVNYSCDEEISLRFDAATGQFVIGGA